MTSIRHGSLLALLGMILSLGVWGCGGDDDDACKDVLCDTPPAATCDGAMAITYGAGTCNADTGACEYEEFSVECTGDTPVCLEGACVAGGDLCDGVTCDEPPADGCDGDSVVSYEAPGTCDDATGDCEYTEVTTACADPTPFCQAGACVAEMVDLCDGVTCNAPPADTCDGDSVVSYEAPGTCDDATGDCDYAETTTACADPTPFCQAGACVAEVVDLCDGVVCNAPPADTCDGDSVVSYEAPGTCDDATGDCEYTEVTTACADPTPFCQAGACVAEVVDLCDGVTCDAPPADICDGDSVVSYEAPGTCDPATGDCDYAETTTACADPTPFCQAGACVAEVVDLCADVVCEDVPIAYCDGDAAVSYEGPGTCDPATGLCAFPETRVDCVDPTPTCQAGACTGGAGGAASIHFEPRFKTGQQWDIAPGIQGSDEMIVMLCDLADPTCEAPVLMRALEAGETDGAPIQNSYGPEVTVTNLPAGTYYFMLFSDSLESKDAGYGWTDDFENTDLSWASACSEGDMLLSSADDDPEQYYNPPVAPIEVTLVDGETLDLEVIYLGHLYNRNIYPEMSAENGLLLISTYLGVRVIDMSVWPYELREAYDVIEGYYEFQFVDDQDNFLPGAVCNIIAGPDKTAFVLFNDSSSGGSGYAVQWDPVTRTQMNMVNWPANVAAGNPCMGSYYEYNGQSYLFLFDNRNIFSANITNLDAGDIEGNVISDGDDELLGVGVHGLLPYETALLVGFNPGDPEPKVPELAEGTRSIFFADFDPVTAQVTFRRDVDQNPEWIQVTGSSWDGYDTAENGYIECYSNFGSPWAAMSIQRFHDGRDLLFVGGCSQILVFDIAADYELLDYNGPLPGKAGLDATKFGHHFNSFVLSPDGTTLWAFPSDKSRMVFSFKWGVDPESDLRSEHNRYMALPIDLTSGTTPNLHASYTTGDIDNFEGLAGLNDLNIPADDPGLDLNIAWYTGYQLKWAPSSSGVTNQAGTFPVGPSWAVSNSTMWMRASGAWGSSSSGMGKMGNVASYSLAERRAYFWPQPEVVEGETMYHYWMSGVSVDYPYGFDLNPGQAGYVETTGMVYIPLD